MEYKINIIGNDITIELIVNNTQSLNVMKSVTDHIENKIKSNDICKWMRKKDEQMF